MMLGRAIARKAAAHGGALGPRQSLGRRASLPAPVKGWNTRDALSGMTPHYAVKLENMFPDRGRIELRRGYSEHATGLGFQAVETLFALNSGTRQKLFGFAGANAYDVTGAGAVGTALKTGLDSARWRGVNIGGYGILVSSGTDAPLSINASGNFVAHGFSGANLNVTRLAQVIVFKHRLFFIEKGTARLWYGLVDAVTGTLMPFNLAYVHPSGGEALALGTMTIDGGAGIDDLLVIFMSSGEAIVYAGTDPTATGDFSLIGVFRLGRVIGDRPLIKLGGDLVAITADGYMPLLQFLKTGRTQTQLAVSDAIASAVSADVRLYGDETGWQAIQYPRANWILFNVPEDDGSHAHQHVMNSQTGAWCLFTNMAASCWELHKDRLYFGGAAGTVYRADDGADDDGGPIRGDAQTAYQYIGGYSDKRFSMLRAFLESNHTINVSLGVGVDFEQDVGLRARVSQTAAGTKWDSAPWDSFPWEQGRVVSRAWQAISGIGTAVSIRIKPEARGQALYWYSTDLIYERAGGI